MKAEAECREVLVQHFKKASDQLLPALRHILRHLPLEVASLTFEFESPHFDDGFPVMYWFTDESGKPRAARKLLPDLEHTIPTAVIYDPKFEAEQLDTWAIASEVFVSWFADCWREAGGGNFSHPAYVAHHDSIHAFDLNRRVEVVRVQ